MSAEKLAETSKYRTIKQIPNIIVETPNSDKTVFNTSHNSKHTNSKRIAEKIAMATPKFRDNSDELNQFLGFAEEQLKKKLKANDAKVILQEKIDKLKNKQSEILELEMKYDMLDTGIQKQRSENWKVKKAIDVFKNQMTQDQLELFNQEFGPQIIKSKRSDEMYPFNKKNNSAEKKSRLSYGGGNSILEPRGRSSLLEVRGRHSLLEPRGRGSIQDQKGRNFEKRQFVRDNLFSGREIGAFRETIGSIQRINRPIVHKQSRATTENLNQVIIKLNKELKILKTEAEIIEKLKSTIDFFQYQVVKRIINRKRNERVVQTHREEIIIEHTHTKKFDFQSIREPLSSNDQEKKSAKALEIMVPDSQDSNNPISSRQIKRSMVLKREDRMPPSNTQRRATDYMDIYKPEVRKSLSKKHALENPAKRFDFISRGLKKIKLTFKGPTSVSKVRTNLSNPNNNLSRRVESNDHKIDIKKISSQLKKETTDIQTPSRPLGVKITEFIPHAKKWTSLRTNLGPENETANRKKIFPHIEKMFERTSNVLKRQVAMHNRKPSKEIKFVPLRIKPLKIMSTRRANNLSICNDKTSFANFHELIKPSSSEMHKNVFPNGIKIKSSSLDK